MNLRWLFLVAAVCALGMAAAPLRAQTLSEIQQAATDGAPEAQFQLGDRYRSGTGVLQNYARAAEWYAAAASQGHAGAINSLGALYISGLGVPADPAKGFALLSEAAKSGNPKHIHDLATAYQSGIGTAANPAKAAELYRQASEQGWQESTVSLAVLYQEGIGVERDIAKAVELYIGPAEAGHPRAQNNLGLIHARGEGVLQDYATAVEWFRKAAAQGLPMGLTNLGVMYENGFGVAVDEEEAKRLYRLAAQGTDDGGAAAPVFVFDPRLAAPDPALVQSYVASANAGDPVAQFLLGYLYVSNAATVAEFRAAAQLFHAAAEKGLPSAMANLGILVFEGKGALQDYVEGYKWLTLAATGGQQEVIAIRDRYAARMTPDQINAANIAAETAWADLAVRNTGAKN